MTIDQMLDERLQWIQGAGLSPSEAEEAEPEIDFDPGDLDQPQRDDFFEALGFYRGIAAALDLTVAEVCERFGIADERKEG